MLVRHELIDRRVQEILQAYRQLLHTAENHRLRPPLIFGGVAVYLLSRREYFRPEANRIATDLDLLIDGRAVSAWEEVLGHRFNFENTRHFSGAYLTIPAGRISLDLLADPEFHFDFGEDRYTWRLRAEESVTLSTPEVWGSIHLVPPVRLLSFKLLMGREPSKGKYDLQDAGALIRSQPLTPEALHAELASGSPPQSLYRLVQQRLAKCCAAMPSPELQRFHSYFQTLAGGAD